MLLIGVSVAKMVESLYYLNMLLIMDLGNVHHLGIVSISLSRYTDHILIDILRKRRDRVKGYSLALNSSTDGICNGYTDCFSNGSLNRQ